MRSSWAVVVLGLVACQQPSVDVPEPPDMGALLASYQAPTAPFTADTVAEIVTRQQALLDELDRMGGLAPVLAALGVLGGETGGSTTVAAGDGSDTLASGLSAGGVTVTGNGFLTLTRACAGWLGATEPDADDGSIRLTAVFSDEGFDAVVWGEALQCRYLAGNHRLLLDGQVRVHTGTLLAGDATAAEVTVAFNGSATVDGTIASTAFSFRLVASTSRVEVELDVSAGNVVFFADEAAGSYGFRAANGTWTCDLEARSCSHADDTLRW